MSNQHIIDQLTLLEQQFKKDSSLKFKYHAIRKALGPIKDYQGQITSGADAKKNITHIGDGIAKRIDEILQTGTLEELKAFKNPVLDSINELKRITGVGDAKAKKLAKAGINSIELYKKNISEGKVKSTHHIDIGIKYLDDLEQRIPYGEIREMEKILRAKLREINPGLIFTICGSFRRGRPTCGDIDILITNPADGQSYLKEYVKSLVDCYFIIDHLTDKGDKKYMGVCRLTASSLARRIDIRYIDIPSYYAAVVYFTGSKNFNIQIRNKALEMGYSLSEYGIKEKGSKKLITFHSEKEVFDFLKMDYVDPKDRDI